MENTNLTRDDVIAIVRETYAQQAEEAFMRREEELAAQEDALAAREKQTRALELLRERGLPEEMAPALAMMTEEETLAAVNAWDESFRNGIRKAVEERLSGDAPATGIMQDVTKLSDADYYASLYPHLM